MTKKLKILELTNFSAGGCGVFARVKQESALLSKNHQVHIFSSNRVKDSNSLAIPKDDISGFKITRFPAKKLGGESFMFWNFKKAALTLKPDVIIAHSYRHPHTTQALKIAKKINAKVFLVTHSPFPKGQTRNIFQKLFVALYDKIVAPKTLNKFDKILTITHYESKILQKLGVFSKNIQYSPNGIPKEFFTKPKNPTEQKKILFLGRITPVKDLETLILSLKYLPNNINLEIVGPAEQSYLDKLVKLIVENKLENTVSFSKPIYSLPSKIQKIDSAKIFVLPSKSEAMPQSLIEAMAREKIVISSNNPGSKELIIDNKNGYLFETGNSKDLADKITLALTSPKSKSIQKRAKSSVSKFSWENLIKQLESLIR
jgi:glycosyltransferase involved in cell wall biosynthesis